MSSSKPVHPIWKEYDVLRATGILAAGSAGAPFDTLKCKHCGTQKLKGVLDRAIGHIAGVSGCGSSACTGPKPEKFPTSQQLEDAKKRFKAARESAKSHWVAKQQKKEKKRKVRSD